MNPMAYGGQSWQLFRPEAWLIQISNFRAVWKRWKKTGEVSQHKCMETSNSLLYGVFPKIGIPQNGWFTWKTRLKWMIWGYHYFRKHPIYRVLLQFCGVSPNKKKTSRFCKPKRRCFSSQVLPRSFSFSWKNRGSLDSKEQPQISKLMIQVFAFIMCIIFVDRKCILCKPNINKHVNLTCVGGLRTVGAGLGWSHDLAVQWQCLFLSFWAKNCSSKTWLTIVPLKWGHNQSAPVHQASFFSTDFFKSSSWMFLQTYFSL